MKRTPKDAGPILRIVEAVSTAGCDGATVTEATGGNPRKIACSKFTAEIYEPHKVDANTEELRATGETVTVWHKFATPMTVDQNLTLLLRPDGRWTILVWVPQDNAIILTPTEGISSRSGITLGAAACEIFRINNANQMVSAGFETVLNMTATPVEGDAYGQAKRVSGRWVIDVEECEVDEPSSSEVE